jgi:hypothetical protein
MGRPTPSVPWAGANRSRTGRRIGIAWSGSVLLVDWFPCRGSIWIRAERPRGDEPVSREGWILWAARRGISWGRPPLQHRAARAWPLILRAPSTVCRPPRAHIEVPDPNPSSVRFCSVPSPHFPLRPALSILLSPRCRRHPSSRGRAPLISMVLALVDSPPWYSRLIRAYISCWYSS